MGALKPGMVDPRRSLAWNLWNYRGSEETREWSTAHDEMYRSIMTIRILAVMLAPIVGLLLLVGLAALLT